MKKVFLFILSVFLAERRNSLKGSAEISREDESVLSDTLSNSSDSYLLSEEKEGFHPHVSEEVNSDSDEKDDNSSSEESETLGLEELYASSNIEETLQVSDKKEESISGKEEECFVREGKVYYLADGTRVTDHLSKKLTVNTSSQPLTPAKLDKSRVEMFLQSQWESKPHRRPSFTRIFRPIIVNNSNTINRTREVDSSGVKELTSSQDHNESAMHTESSATEGVVEKSQPVKDLINTFSALCNNSANLSINPRVVDAIPKEDSAKSTSPENSSSDTEKCVESSESEKTSDETSSVEEFQRQDFFNGATCSNNCAHGFQCTVLGLLTNRKFRKVVLKQKGEGFIVKFETEKVAIKELTGEVGSTDLENRNDVGKNETTTLVDKSGVSSSFSVENTPAQGEICGEYQQDNQQGKEKDPSDSEERTDGKIESHIDESAINNQGSNTTTSSQLESQPSSSTATGDSLSAGNVDSLQNARRLVGRKKATDFLVESIVVVSLKEKRGLLLKLKLIKYF